MRCKDLKKQSGFTFIEIIISVSILAIIMTVSQSILLQMIRGKNSLDEIRDIEVVLNNITNRLNKEFQLAERVSLPDETKCNSESVVKEQNEIYLCGESGKNRDFRQDKITFMSRRAQQYLRAKYIAKSKRITDLVMITYRVEKGKDKHGSTLKDEYWLIRDEVPVINNELQEDNKMTFPVYKNIKEFKVRYFNATDDKWEDKWSNDGGEPVFPDLIEFTIKIEAEAKKKIFSNTSTINMISKD